MRAGTLRRADRPGHRWARAVSRLLVLVATVGVTMLMAPQLAHACDNMEVRHNPDGSISYVCTDGTSTGTPGEPGGGGASTPSCTLLPPATFCDGTTPCYIKDNVAPYAPPQGPPPSKDAQWHVVMCFSGATWSGTAVWDNTKKPQPPSLQEQALTAFGALRPPTAQLRFNPDHRTLVYLDTWFWAEGLSAGPLTGSSAFGLVARATPDHLELDPGDGSGPTTCPWTTSRSAQCSYVYPRSSVSGSTHGDDGQPAFAATARPVWTVTFAVNGTPVTIPGAPTELKGPTSTAAVEVAETQAIVTYGF